MPEVSYPYEVNGKLVTGNGSLIPICSLSNCSLSPSLTVQAKIEKVVKWAKSRNIIFKGIINNNINQIGQPLALQQ